MSKWLPPLTCPIPKLHPSHYLTTETKLRQLLSVKRAYKSVFEEEKDPWADLSDRKSTFNRIFARRKNKNIYRYKQSGAKKRIPSRLALHKIKFRWGLEGVNYFLLDAESNVVKVYRTKREGLADLVKDSVKVKKRGSWRTVDLRPGMRLVGLPDWPVDVFDISRPKTNQHFPTVQVKRCGSCPNATSNKGVCHCQFWDTIRGDNVNKVNWLSPHEWTMRHHRLKKREEHVFNLNISLKDLFD